MSKLIIAIDGPVGSGKSSVARRVAELLGYAYLDSGAMYRAVAWKALRDGVPLDSTEKLEDAGARDADRSGAARMAVLRVLVDGEDVTEQHPLGDGVASGLARGRRAGRAHGAGGRAAARRRAGGVVMEGRDIGTVVFPRRRAQDFSGCLGGGPRRAAAPGASRQRRACFDLAEMLEEVRQRDRRDRERAVSPLVRADDAVLVDNTAMDVEETARLIVLLARDRGAAARQTQSRAKRRRNEGVRSSAAYGDRFSWAGHRGGIPRWTCSSPAGPGAIPSPPPATAG